MTCGLLKNTGQNIDILQSDFWNHTQENLWVQNVCRPISQVLTEGKYQSFYQEKKMFAEKK
jgi:predicted secreted protein